MRLRVAHSSVYRYDPPATGVIQVLRLTPRNHDGQYVERWRIDVTPDVRLTAQEDAFGNISHVFTADGPLERLRVDVYGEAETQNTDGIVRGTVERFPPSLFLRDTALTQADLAVREFAAGIRAERGASVLAQLHGLLDRLYEEIAQDTPQGLAQRAAHQKPVGNSGAPAPIATAAQTFAAKSGTPAELAQLFIGAAHSLDIPARFVSGYCRRAHGDAASDTGHAWAEAYAPGLGWVAFDPANGLCPTDGHVRVAIALDALGAAPVRGTYSGPGIETVAMAIKVEQ
jgi:transglutaminase-like putative cysteine protease